MRFSTILLKNLMRRKTRSALTATGVAIAVGTTISLLGVSDSFERATMNDFDFHGIDIVIIETNVLDQLTSDLPQAAAESIKAVPGVREVGPGLIDLIRYATETTDVSVPIQGWKPDGFMIRDLEIKSGRRLEVGDKKQVMLGEQLADVIEKKVGDTIELDEVPFEIVGTYKSASVHENSAITVPLAELQDLMQREGSVTGFSLLIDNPSASTEEVEAICRQINQLVDERGRSFKLFAQPTEQYVTGSLHIQMAHAMAWLTSLIAIVVGAVGMLNTMVMSVVERIREISILRAIGWRKSRVMNMILGESLLLSLAGAVLGALVAMLVIKWLTTVPAVSGIIQGDLAPIIIAKGFLLALSVGLVGGLYPAYRATRLLPCEGLHHE